MKQRREDRPRRDAARRSTHKRMPDALQAEIDVLWYFARRLRVLTDEFEEMVQEVSLAFMEQQPRFQGKGGKSRLRAWLRRVFRGKIVDEWRRRKRSPVKVPDSLLEKLLDHRDAEAAVAEVLERRRELLGLLLEELRVSDPPNYRLLYGRYFERRGVKELAATEGLTESQVSSRIYSAKQRLRKRAAELGADEEASH
jgi:RNA polymerase sigma factor (sigma-70 family)